MTDSYFFSIVGKASWWSLNVLNIYHKMSWICHNSFLWISGQKCVPVLGTNPQFVTFTFKFFITHTQWPHPSISCWQYSALVLLPTVTSLIPQSHSCRPYTWHSHHPAPQPYHMALTWSNYQSHHFTPLNPLSSLTHGRGQKHTSMGAK